MKLNYKSIAIWLAVLIVFAMSLLIINRLYSIGGVYWDFVARMLFARTLLSPYFYSSIIHGTSLNAITYANNFYIEPFREPLPSLLMTPFVLLGVSIKAYLFFELVLLLLALIYFCKVSKKNIGLAVLLFFTSYTLTYLSVLDGSELLSMIFLVFSAAFLIKESGKSGIFLALAGLAKYTSLIFLPVLLILPKGTRKKAFLYFILTTIPWLVFNFIAFRNPLYSYLYSIALIIFNKASYTNLNPTNAILLSLKIIFSNLVPLFTILLFVLIFYYLVLRKDKKNRIDVLELKRFSELKTEYRVSLSLLLLSILGWSILAVSNSINTLPRWGYLIYFGLLIFLIILLNDLFALKVKSGLLKHYGYVAYTVLFIVMIALLLTNFISLKSNFPFDGYGTTNSTLLNTISVLNSSKIPNCNFVSNGWVYLRYYGVIAHSPYYYNATIYHYDIISFNKIGVQPSIINTSQVVKTENYTGFSIETPNNYSCS
jgi:hypothetical protein